MLTIQDMETVFQNRTLGIQETRGEYAVLLPLVEREGELSLLFEVRAETLKGHQPGEVCFPGGRIESGEGPRAAALRETWEEVGIPPQAVQVIAPLDVVQDISDRVIYPFLGQVDADAVAHLAPSADEVKEIFFVPLSYLRSHPPYIHSCPVISHVGNDFPYEQIGFGEGYQFREGIMEIPVYRYQDHAIWGITGRMVRWFLRQLDEAGI